MKLLDAYTLTNLLTPYLDKTLPARAAFSIGKFLTSSKDDLALYLKTQEQLILKYSKESNKAENGALNFKISTDKLPAFEKEMTDLNNTEIDIQLKLYYEDLESLSLTPREVVKLLPYIE